MFEYLLGQDAMWLGGMVMVMVDLEKTDLVETIQGEMDFMRVFPGPGAMYGKVKGVAENGDLKIHFLRAMEAEEGDRNTNYLFEAPRGTYIVIRRSE